MPGGMPTVVNAVVEGLSQSHGMVVVSLINMYIIAASCWDSWNHSMVDRPVPFIRILDRLRPILPPRLHRSCSHDRRKDRPRLSIFWRLAYLILGRLCCLTEVPLILRGVV